MTVRIAALLLAITLPACTRTMWQRPRGEPRGGRARLASAIVRPTSRPAPPGTPDTSRRSAGPCRRRCASRDIAGATPSACARGATPRWRSRGDEAEGGDARDAARRRRRPDEITLYVTCPIARTSPSSWSWSTPRTRSPSRTAATSPRARPASATRPLKPGWAVSVTARPEGDREVADVVKAVLER